MARRTPIEGKKARNFRFSDEDMDRLDQVVAYFSENRDALLFFERATRTDVLRYLIRERLMKIEEQARIVEKMLAGHRKIR